MTVDFIALLVICYAYVELKDAKFDNDNVSLFSSTFVRAHTRTEVLDAVAFFVWIVFPYLNAIAVFFTATLVFNFLTFLYVPLVFHMLLNHVRFASGVNGERELHFGRDWKAWRWLFAFAVVSIFVRFAYQLPYIKSTYAIDSYAMILGLRKSQLDLTRDKSTPPELVVDAVIASIVAVQMWLLKRKEVDLICNTAEVEEHFRKQNGSLVIAKIQSKRNQSMEEVRWHGE